VTRLTRLIVLLIAVLAAPLVVVLGSMLAGRSYYGSLAQSPSPSTPTERSVSVMSPQPTERSSTASALTIEETTALQESSGWPGPPEITLSYGRREVTGAISASSCWGGLCSDGLPTVPPPKKALSVPSGSEMVLHYGRQRPPNKLSVRASKLLGRVDASGGGLGRHYSLKARGSGVVRTIPVELPPGEYLVSVSITERLGQVPYTFRVIVQ
jgi:hypothetical protein